MNWKDLFNGMSLELQLSPNGFGRGTVHFLSPPLVDTKELQKGWEQVGVNTWEPVNTAAEKDIKE